MQADPQSKYFCSMKPTREMSSERGNGCVRAEAMMNRVPISTCLTCGNQGWPEWLVFCNKCHVYALHRYCLDGPVIIHDAVTWFCEECELEKPPSPMQNKP
ncbi:uncharacterized protein LOC114756478 [Neltuma alba]|uniref:uncharacterized protein LOC114756478 n=1 Tax=Neltuma alba TaxID=207710 RepID=UPI0010A3FF96|nr:uncharacterized protein LOC114756478 [Prosopis alba]